MEFKITRTEIREKIFKPIYEIKSPIYGLFFYSSQLSKSNKDSLSNLIIILTDESIIQLYGENTLESILENPIDYRSKNNRIFPKTKLPCELKIYYKKKLSKYYPYSLVVLTDSILIKANFTEQNDNTIFMLINFNFEYHPLIGKNDLVSTPISIGISEYHLYYVYSDSLLIYTINTKCQKFSYNFMKTEEIFGIYFDPFRFLFWITTSKNIYQLYIQCEEKDVWKLHLENNLYLDALNCAKKTNEKMYPLVSNHFANYLYNKEKYEDAAEKYAYSNIDFEEAVLKFLSDKRYKSLSIYLTILLSLTPKYSKYKVKRLLLCSFLLNELLANLVKIENDDFQKQNYTEKNHVNINLIGDKNPLIKFLNENLDDLDLESTTFYLQTQGKFFESYEFSTIKKSYEYMINYNIFYKQFLEALNVFKLIPDSNEDKINLFKKHLFLFIREIPIDTINFLQDNIVQIDLEDIILPLSTINIKYQEKAINYLFSKIKIKGSSSIFNFLFFLLLQQISYILIQKNSTNIDYYYNLLNELIELDKETNLINYEEALNCCKHFENNPILVKVYEHLMMYEEAFNLSIRLESFDEAKKYAFMPKDEKLKKKLLLKYIESLLNNIKENQKRNSNFDNSILVKSGLEVIKESKILKIEDVLMFLEDSIQVSIFKEQIIPYINEYEKSIASTEDEINIYKGNINNFSKTNQNTHIKENNFLQYRSNDLCEKCLLPLIQKSKSYLFNCGHYFHSFCFLEIFDEVKNSINESKFKKRVVKIDKYFKLFSALILKYAKENIPITKQIKEMILGIKENDLNQIKEKMKIEEQENIESYIHCFEKALSENCIYCFGLIELIDAHYSNENEKEWDI